MMRVLVLGWEFPPYMSGGLGTACFHMTKALAHKGTKIMFIQPQMEGVAQSGLEEGLTLQSASGTKMSVIREMERTNGRVDDFWKNNLSIHVVDSPLYPYATAQTYQQYRSYVERSQICHEGHETEKISGGETMYIRGGYGPGLMDEVFRYSRAVAAIAAKEDFDIIHVHDWMTYPAGILTAEASGRPLIMHAHSLEYDRSGVCANPDVFHIEEAGFNRADQIIAVSHYTKNLIMQEYKIPESKIDVVHNAVSRSEAYKAYQVPVLMKDEKRVLFLGRITYQKGPDYFVEAARLVLDRLPKTRFIMAGSGDMMLNLVRRVGQLRMGRQFHFTGFMDRLEVERMYALSDLYVMPSVSEPFGITPLEAMACDVPVLISRQSGVAEVLHSALKVDFWDVREMANKICAVLRYPSLAAEVVKNSREDLKNIKWENAADLLRGIYSRFV